MWGLVLDGEVMEENDEVLIGVLMRLALVCEVAGRVDEIGEVSGDDS